jgi:hypothetical protein
MDMEFQKRRDAVDAALQQTLNDVFAMFNGSFIEQSSIDMIKKEITVRMQDYLRETNPQWWHSLRFTHTIKDEVGLMFHPADYISKWLLEGEPDSRIQWRVDTEQDKLYYPHPN